MGDASTRQSKKAAHEEAFNIHAYRSSLFLTLVPFSQTGEHMGMDYNRLHLRVKKIWQDQEGESLLIDFDGAGLVVYCVYSFEPLQVDLEDLVGQTVKELEESEFKYTITFTNGSKLQLEPISDKFIFAPEALIYHNNSFYPPLEVVIDKIEQDAR